jgi:hypothetical protein
MIHDTQDTFKIHSGYIWDTSRYTSRYVSRANLEPYLRPRLDAPEIRVPHVLYPPCIPHVHVFRMYPACILITSEDTCISHVSRMYPACLLHIRYISLEDAFEIHVDAACQHVRQTLKHAHLWTDRICHDLPKAAHDEQSKSLTPPPPPRLRLFETSLGISANLTPTQSTSGELKPNEWR